TSQRILVADIRRDLPNNAALNSITTVVVKDDTAAVRAANPSYLHLPANWYTLEAEVAKVGGVPVSDPNPAIRGMGGTWTFTFQPGEFAKQIYVVIPNATLLNPSALYALGFTITTVTNGKISKSKSVVIEIGAKNDWDGIYAVTGPMIDAAVPTIIQWNNPASGDPFVDSHGGGWEAHLVTTAGNECVVFDRTIWDLPAHPILNGGANSGYSAAGIVIRFDAATNTVSDLFNWYGDPTRGPANTLGNPATGSGPPNYSASNTRRLTLDPSGINAVQGNKDILIKYFMYQPSVIAGVRTTFNEKWEYTGPR
ncbi:MAG TPA: hypothetical protein VMZ03_08725, partial [Chitinophagaceae bacterium]|nr:hypothetical protein [Chitinophagaceae bacterium]